MLKKLAAAAIAAAIAVSSMPVMAMRTSIVGVAADEGVIYNEQGKDRMILCGYDENGVLKGSWLFTAGDDGMLIPFEVAQYKLRAIFPGEEGIYDFEIANGEHNDKEPEETAKPQATAEPEATVNPTVSPTAAPNKQYPDIYERQIDAIDAIAVIDKVSSGENNNQEKIYYVDALYQGEEIRLDIKEEVNITSASDEFSYMTGQPVSALKKGDVICFTANLSGRINKVGLVYRPLDKNIVTDGNDYGSSFEKLISNNGSVAERRGWSVMRYGGGGRSESSIAFGVVKDKDKNSVTLLGPDGDIRKAINLGIQDNTIVYVCDMSSKKELSVEDTSGISKSVIPRNAENEQGIITYSDDDTMSYALLRVVNGTVTDAVIYTNYNN